jgi:hypothetical protein
MKQQMHKVTRRRRELLAKISSQRMQIAEIGTRWQPQLLLADQFLAGMRFLRPNPVLVGSVVVPLVIRRRGVFGMLMGGWLCGRDTAIS